MSNEIPPKKNQNFNLLFQIQFERKEKGKNIKNEIKSIVKFDILFYVILFYLFFFRNFIENKIIKSFSLTNFFLFPDYFSTTKYNLRIGKKVGQIMDIQFEALTCPLVY